MTLKKDALIAVSLASVVLVLAVGSTKLGTPGNSAANSSATEPAQDVELLRTYIEFVSEKAKVPSEERELRLRRAREKAFEFHRQGRLDSPIDLMRASAILASSTDPRELSLAHDLAAEALSRGVKMARQIVLEAEDRLLLSAGRPQRYGTQRFWNGKELPGGPFPYSSELTTKDQNTIRPGQNLPLNSSD